MEADIEKTLLISVWFSGICNFFLVFHLLQSQLAQRGRLISGVRLSGMERQGRGLSGMERQGLIPAVPQPHGKLIPGAQLFDGGPIPGAVLSRGRLIL